MLNTIYSDSDVSSCSVLGGLPVELHVDTFKRAARLRNLSAGGAMVEMIAPPEPGVDVALVQGEGCRIAVVVWSRARFCGIMFV